MWVQRERGSFKGKEGSINNTTPSKLINSYYEVFVWGKFPYEKLWDHLGKREKSDLRSTKLTKRLTLCEASWARRSFLCSNLSEQIAHRYSTFKCYKKRKGIQFKYSGDPKSPHVRILNGQIRGVRSRPLNYWTFG